MSDYTGPVLFADLETTGTDPHALRASILEAGFVLTDGTPELNVIAEANLVIRPLGDRHDHETLWAEMPPVVRDMHTANGLWTEATDPDADAWNATDADLAIARWLESYIGDFQVALAGSGVGHFDLQWIRRHLPRVASDLTYWVFDVGVIRRSLALAGRRDLVDLATDVEAKTHRALADAHLHVAEARRYLTLFRSIPMASIPLAE